MQKRNSIRLHKLLENYDIPVDTEDKRNTADKLSSESQIDRIIKYAKTIGAFKTISHQHSYKNKIKVLKRFADALNMSQSDLKYFYRKYI